MKQAGKGRGYKFGANNVRQEVKIFKINKKLSKLKTTFNNEIFV